jgi:ABC-type transport system substrate-binding protein
MLQVPLRSIVTAEQGPGLWLEPVSGETAANDRPFERTGPPESDEGQPRFVVEVQFENDEAALAALARGEVDVIDRVPPWQLGRLEQSPDIAVAAYRLPTVHVLIPHAENELLQTREFRRALCYGIDADSILRDILLAGQSRQGFRTISGPFLAGASLSDPVGYAYDPDLQVRPYEPRLAAILAGIARQMIAKREAEARKKQAAEVSEEQPKGDQAESTDENAVAAKENSNSKPPPEPLILAHSTDPLARLACQTIKTQLDAIGIPIKLAEFAGGAPDDDMKYDLLYAELAVWEPIAEARRLLGPEGLAGSAGPLMVMALDQLAQAENWNQARAQLHEIHRIAHHDLPVLPLWQTPNHFAYRRTVEGVSDNPVTLYLNLSAWRKKFD